MEKPIKYAVEPMYDTKNNNLILGYIVSKCLVKKSSADYGKNCENFYEVTFPFACHEDIKNYTYDPFEKSLRTRVVNIYDDYEHAKCERDFLTEKLYRSEVIPEDYDIFYRDYIDSYDLRISYFQEIETIVQRDTEYIEITEDKSRVRL